MSQETHCVLLESNEFAAAVADKVCNSREPSLIWAYAGEGHVAIGADVYALSQGDAIWVPAGLEYDIRSSPNSVLIPIFPAARRAHVALAVPTRTHFTADWNDWLVYQFARSIGYLRGAAAAQGLAGIVVGSPGSTPGGTPVPAPSVPLPPRPSSPEASRVALRLMQDPADSASVAALASGVSVSARTLQAQFSSETGFSISEWRTQVRIAAAATYIDIGHDIGWTAQQVGYATPAGFTKAFLRRTGVTPSSFAQRRGQRVDLSETGIDLALPDAVGETHADADRRRVPPVVPSSKTWDRVSDFHVLVWVYRGSARVEIAGELFNLREGDAAWLPAGLSNSVSLPAGSILLPLGSQGVNYRADAPDVLVQRFSDDAGLCLMHTMVANYSRLRPAVHDPHAITRAFAQQSAVTGVSAGARTSSKAAHVRALAAELHRAPADRRGLSEWADRFEIEPAQLASAIISITGMGFSRWQSQIRMTMARRRLEEGLSVAQVAQALGYAHASGFSRVFTRRHGLSPRAYQRGGWQQTAEPLIVP
ncbi:AraC-like DNA-binding protein [Leucobacter komagatae]|uniref:AraC-like DNA-binding protein n=1 Tax=Leucobacter komagatae TaxID=55969 RepID=A0A542Y209_9MICO|nr:helix-turn-helix domain-containing protein [Leucobacter komagatae]TQL42109.1 AraC-like DNA-binding protein [Leucobacter komagatae]